MKKNYLLLFLIPLLLVVVTACTNTKKEESKENTITLKDEKVGKTTFTYDKNSKYTNIEEDNGGASTEITFENEDLDLEFEMYYNTMRKNTYNNSKETRSAQKYYKEYKFGDYEAYAYGEYTSGLYLNIILSEDENDYTVLFVSIDRMDANTEVIVSDVVADKEVQKLFKSIKFEKAK